MSVMVAVQVEVSEKEWMDRYGDHIVKNQLVPEVTLEKATRKAVREAFARLNMPGTSVDGIKV